MACMGGREDALNMHPFALWYGSRMHPDVWWRWWRVKVECTRDVYRNEHQRSQVHFLPFLRNPFFSRENQPFSPFNFHSCFCRSKENQKRGKKLIRKMGGNARSSLSLSHPSFFYSNEKHSKSSPLWLSHMSCSTRGPAADIREESDSNTWCKKQDREGNSDEFDMSRGGRGRVAQRKSRPLFYPDFFWVRGRNHHVHEGWRLRVKR